MDNKLSHDIRINREKVVPDILEIGKGEISIVTFVTPEIYRRILGENDLHTLGRSLRLMWRSGIYETASMVYETMTMDPGKLPFLWIMTFLRQGNSKGCFWSKEAGEAYSEAEREFGRNLWEDQLTTVIPEPGDSHSSERFGVAPYHTWRVAQSDAQVQFDVDTFVKYPKALPCDADLLSPEQERLSGLKRLHGTNMAVADFSEFSEEQVTTLLERAGRKIVCDDPGRDGIVKRVKMMTHRFCNEYKLLVLRGAGDLSSYGTPPRARTVLNQEQQLKTRPRAAAMRNKLGEQYIRLDRAKNRFTLRLPIAYDPDRKARHFPFVDDSSRGKALSSAILERDLRLKVYVENKSPESGSAYLVIMDEARFSEWEES